MPHASILLRLLLLPGLRVVNSLPVAMRVTVLQKAVRDELWDLEPGGRRGRRKPQIFLFCSSAYTPSSAGPNQPTSNSA